MREIWVLSTVIYLPSYYCLLSDRNSVSLTIIWSNTLIPSNSPASIKALVILISSLLGFKLPDTWLWLTYYWTWIVKL